MSKGFVVDQKGNILAYGYDGKGTKIERIKSGNSFVTSASDKVRYDALHAKLRDRK